MMLSPFFSCLISHENRPLIQWKSGIARLGGLTRSGKVLIPRTLLIPLPFPLSLTLYRPQYPFSSAPSLTNLLHSLGMSKKRSRNRFVHFSFFPSSFLPFKIPMASTQVKKIHPPFPQAKRFARAMHASLVFCSTSASINVQKIFKIVLAKAFDLKCVIPEIEGVGEPILIYVDVWILSCLSPSPPPSPSMLSRCFLAVPLSLSLSLSFSPFAALFLLCVWTSLYTRSFCNASLGYVCVCVCVVWRGCTEGGMVKVCFFDFYRALAVCAFHLRECSLNNFKDLEPLFLLAGRRDVC